MIIGKSTIILFAAVLMLGTASCKSDNSSNTDDKNKSSDPSDTTPEGCACIDEETREGTTECGLNNNGVLMQLCSDCEWLDNPDECVDPDVCENGDTQEGDPCGEVCVDGQWEATCLPPPRIGL